MSLVDVLRIAVCPALARLSSGMDTPAARVMLIAIGLQESRLIYRRQRGGGPARGLWQFERGTEATRGGVTGVLLHHRAGPRLRAFCVARGAPIATPPAIYAELEHDDVLAAAVARLLLWTDPDPLPALDDADGAWAYYLRLWRPGKPHPETWRQLHARARAAVEAFA